MNANTDSSTLNSKDDGEIWYKAKSRDYDSLDDYALA